MATALPSIDLQPFIAGSGQGRRPFRGLSHRRAKRSASSSIRGHGLPQTLIETAFATAGDFFGEPQAIKDRSAATESSSARGYHALLTKNLAKTLGYEIPPICASSSTSARSSAAPPSSRRSRRLRALRREIWPRRLRPTARSSATY